ncbi:hypothetical protein [Actomonas aquatica]|uniref:Uncharacterized protein n=1 Tax=Actomonas aquatica TaxID=2866162 RepID=A0ABZ1C716_9BACT|nr:hypothetical protein [Opitutus sp. WL0086]WRQ87127.1 hypothetical protein K1X11_020130 [Opitutus sp. WL0086]
MSDSYHSKAWLLDGPIHSLPGLLSYDATTDRLCFRVLESGTFSNARLTELFTACGHAPEPGSPPPLPATLFDLARTELRGFRMPWYYFGGGAILDLGFSTGPLRFAFIKPQNTVWPSAYNEDLREWVGGEGQAEVKVNEGKTAGRHWRTLLA